MVMDTKMNWPAVMDQIHYIEHHYKSLLSIPDSHPAMKKLHKLTHTEEIRRYGNYKSIDSDKVIRLIKAGYNYQEIGSMTGKSDAQIENVAYRNGCPRRVQFHNIYYAQDGKVYYASSFNALSKIAGENLKVYKVRERLKKEGTLVTVPKIYWYEVPYGALYLTSAKSGPKVKQGIDSYQA